MDKEALAFHAVLREGTKDHKVRLHNVFYSNLDGNQDTLNKCQLCSGSLNDPGMCVFLSDDLSPLTLYDSTHSFYRSAA